MQSRRADESSVIRPPFVVKELDFQQVTGFHIAWCSATELTGGDVRQCDKMPAAEGGASRRELLAHRAIEFLRVQ